MRVTAIAHLEKNDFPEIAAELEQRVADAMNIGIANFVSASSAIIPRDTGAMAGNIVINMATAGDLTGGVGYEQEYSVYVHEGTVYLSPQPWARTVADAMQNEYANLVRSRALGAY